MQAKKLKEEKVQVKTLKEQFDELQPEFKTSIEASKAFQSRLDEIAKSHSISVHELLNRAETSSEWRPDFSEALMLQRRIARYSKK